MQNVFRYSHVYPNSFDIEEGSSHDNRDRDNPITNRESDVDDILRNKMFRDREYTFGVKE